MSHKLVFIALSICVLPAPSLVAGEEPQPKGKETTAILAADAEYYATSPAQGRPPDGKLMAGAKVRVLEKAGSYVRVAFQVEGYVAAESLKPAPAGREAKPKAKGEETPAAKKKPADGPSEAKPTAARKEAAAALAEAEAALQAALAKKAALLKEREAAAQKKSIAEKEVAAKKAAEQKKQELKEQEREKK